MGLAAKNMQEENRSLLQKSEAFGDLAKNKFINAPDLNYQSSKSDFQELRNIKIQKFTESKRQSLIIKVCIIVLMPALLLALWYIL